MELRDATTLDTYGQSLREDGHGWSLRVAGRGTSPLPVQDWTCEHRPGDEVLLALCTGSVLDVGCGPGRLTAALARAGREVLGIDVAPAAVALAHERGARALLLDVFGPVPGSGAWGTVLLADGNVGIGGDPTALLRRCGQLLAGGGRVVLELGAPPVRSRADLVRLEHAGRSRCSGWFPWASLSVRDVEQVAVLAGLHVTDTARAVDGRWFAVVQAGTVPGGDA